MKIGIANDHRGVKLKEELICYLKEKYDIINFGTNTDEPVDYPIYAKKVGEAVKNKKIEKGILICRTGIGMSISCNKIKTVRCAKVNTVEEAYLSRIDNDANVIALSYSIPLEENKKIIDTFLETSFTNIERHVRRINLIDS